MNKIRNIGDVFNGCRVVEITKSHGAKTRARVLCRCGKEFSTILSDLCRGHVRSCGCLQRMVRSANGKALMPIKHGMSGTRTYKSYDAMMYRCYSKNAVNYESYGGRGISVCRRWRESFEAFLLDMGERPEGMSIDRIDSNGMYEPTNCRWATRAEQSRNTSDTKITLNIAREIRCAGSVGRSYCEIASVFGITRAHASKVIRNIIWREDAAS